MRSLKRPNHHQTPEPKRSGWQVPASCGFCRLKKIRCDKQHPCSNCIARDVACEYASVPQGTEHPLFPKPSPESTSLADIQEIKDRLERVEQLLLKSSDSITSSKSKEQVPVTHTPQSQPEVTPATTDLRKWDNLESIAATSEIEEANNSQPNNKSRFVTAATTTASPAQLSQTPFPSSESRADRLLPQSSEARTLLEHYIQGVDGQCQVIHAPSTRNLLKQLYSQLAQSIDPPDEVLTFFLSIFASASFYLRTEPILYSPSSSSSPDELRLDRGQPHSWKEEACQRVFHIDHMFSSSLMSLQSALIVLLLLWDSEGQSKRYHTLKGLAYVKAMQLGIHQIDAEPSDGKPDSLEREMKRRLWWHLACSDWLVGSAPGRQLGACMINPRHMTVNYPANVAYEDFVPEGHSTDPDPDRSPTSMSFFLYRIKFAELCREAMDDIQQAKATRSPQQIYQLVLEISNRYMSFLYQLPWFLKLDGDESRLAELARERPYTTQQRAILLYGIYSRLGRLHRPFVTRGITDPVFLNSYKIGIECAESLLTIRRMTTQGQLDMFGRSHSFDQHSFNAMILLALDVMAHPNLESSERRKGELIEMCSSLKDKHIQIGQPPNGLSRAIELLLETVQNPKSHQTKGATDKVSHISLNSGQAKDDEVVAESDVSLVSEAPFQMSWMDECFPSFCDQEYNILFDNLQGNLSSLGHTFWEESVELEGILRSNSRDDVK